MLTELERRMDEESEKFNKEIENTKNISNRSHRALEYSS